MLIPYAEFEIDLGIFCKTQCVTVAKDRFELRTAVCVFLDSGLKGCIMDTPGFSSPLNNYQKNLRMMCDSHDHGGKEKTELDSLGVIDLDQQVLTDIFGLKAFNESLPITQMLPGSSPCELRLLIPDSAAGEQGFHDVIMENLTASSTWRLRHVSNSDVSALRRRWPRSVFQTMRERGREMEVLRRQPSQRPEWAYRLTKPGPCYICKTVVDGSLQVHMTEFHLELGQLWRCPVEWCAVWKGTVRECRENFDEKHGGSATLDFGKVPKPFTPWTVPRSVWKTALRSDVSGVAVDVKLFHEAGCRLVHKYRVYRDPLPHTALRGGVIPKLLSVAVRAMAIARLTHLHLSIPASGAPAGEVPAHCFPIVGASTKPPRPQRVSFTQDVPLPMADVQLQFSEPVVDPDIGSNLVTETMTGPVTVPETPAQPISPPPGFPQFSWPQTGWIPEGEDSIDPGLQFVTSWSARIVQE